jgi:DNA mismatch endonuclease (patch repair protein)
MVDTFSPAKRSAIMARIGGKDTAPEMRVRRLLHALGFRFRLHATALPGKPDIVLPRYRKVIFVHGCFWHAHTRCRRATLPTTNAEFWTTKIGKNRMRDRRARRQLRRLGWGVLVLWQCQLSDMDFVTSQLVNFLQPASPISAAPQRVPPQSLHRGV